MCPSPTPSHHLPLGSALLPQTSANGWGGHLSSSHPPHLPAYLHSLLSREFYTLADTTDKRNELWDSRTPVAAGLGYFVCLNGKVVGTVWIYRWRGSWAPASLRQLSKGPQAWKKKLPPWVGLPDLLREREMMPSYIWISCKQQSFFSIGI